MGPITSLDKILEVLKFPFRDPEWKRKVLIGCLIMLAAVFIPLLPMLALTGYAGQIMKRLLRGDGQLSLPEWDNWGQLLIDGLKIWAVSLIYGLPILLLLLVAFGSFFIPMFGSVALAQDSQTESLSVLLSFCGIGVSMVLFMLVMVFSIAVGFFSSVAIGHMVAKDDFSAAFDFKGWWPILKAGFTSFLVVYLAMFVVGFVIAMISQVLIATIILCFLYPVVLFAFSFFSVLYTYPLYALAYLDGKNKLAA
jgi:hypothetical protein